MLFATLHGKYLLRAVESLWRVAGDALKDDHALEFDNDCPMPLR